MQRKNIKSENGVTLMLLVITIIVLTLISVPVLINFKNIKQMNEYTAFKADMDSLNEGISLAYKYESDISSIGPVYMGNIAMTSEKDINDNDVYYLISLENLNAKLAEGAKIELKNGDINKTYKSNTKYNESANTFSDGDTSSIYDAYIVNQKSRTVYYLKGVNYNSKQYNKLNESSTAIVTSVNAPKLSDGMIPIKYYNGSWQICSETNSEWFNYTENSNSTTSSWANVMLSDGRFKKQNGEIVDSQNSNTVINVNATSNYTISDSDLGSMFVWIPRFAYKINSGLNSSTAGTISVKFLQGTSNNDFDGNEISTKYISSNYVVHPAFTNGTANKFANGEWDEEITGFWISKFPAGYQANTLKISTDGATAEIANGTDAIVYSNKHYTSDNKTNAIANANKDNAISYPVFKPLTFVYNFINSGDMYRITKDMVNTDYYGLKNVDSHMIKNSEWGAVAYLTQSQYGRNGTEPYINNFNMNNKMNNRCYAVTGLYASSQSAAETSSIGNVKAYNTSVGVNGSSTGNATGVYDLNGCAWQRTSSYITNSTSATSNVISYGAGIASPILDETPNTDGVSTKWTTAYPFNSTSDSSSNNWKKFVSMITTLTTTEGSTYGFGDAIYETSINGWGSYSWNADKSQYPETNNFQFERAGYYGYGKISGIFCYTNTSGIGDMNDGFRITLINN